MSFAAIFDMDGVLIDSLTPNLKGHQAALKHFGADISLKDLEEDIHLSMPDKVTKWRYKYGVKMTEKEYIDKAVEMQLKHLHDLEVKIELVHLLRSLKENNIRLAVATNSPRAKAEPILEKVGIRKYFNIIVTGDDVEKRKPNPEMFILAASRLQTKPEKCVVFEDAGTGVLAAKTAGMKAIGVLTEYNSKQELKHADVIVKDFKEINHQKLIELIKRQNEL